MKRIAVIFGGNGFIGSHLARDLVSSGEYSRVVSADISDNPRFSTPGVEYIHCDIRSPIDEKLVPGVSEIYNLAAVHVTPGHQDWEYFWTNVLGALNVTNYARQARVSTLVFTSSISVYGMTEAAKTELSQLAPESAYGRSKVCAEAIHRQWQDELGQERRLIIPRPAVVFGYNERGNFTRLARLLERKVFVYPGRKDTVKACGYVTDLIRSIRFFLGRPEKVIVYNFAFSDRLTIEEICKAFGRVASYRLPRWVMPIRLIMLLGMLFEFMAKIGFRTSVNRVRLVKLVRSTNISPTYLDESGFKRSFNLEEALADWKKQSPAGRFE